MKKEFGPRPLDVRAFAQAAGHLEGIAPVDQLPRLAAELAPGPTASSPVAWSAAGSTRQARGAAVPQVWLELEAEATVPLVCQRCLEPVQTHLQFTRAFRFVADERTAAEEDEAADEDVLVFSRDFDLIELVEDELLMALPLVPRHEVCPADAAVPPAGPALAEQAPQERRQPFAVLGALKGNKSS